MIERIGEKFEVKRDELRKELPDKLNFVKCYVYKQGKCLDQFMINDYEQYIEKYINPKVVPSKAVLKNSFMESVSKSGYGVEVELDEKKFEPRWKEFLEKHVKLEKEFKDELFKNCNVVNNTKAEEVFKFCNKDAIKNGGFNFIEEYFIDILKIMDLVKE